MYVYSKENVFVNDNILVSSFQQSLQHPSTCKNEMEYYRQVHVNRPSLLEIISVNNIGAQYIPESLHMQFTIKQNLKCNFSAINLTVLMCVRVSCSKVANIGVSKFN